MSSIRKRTWTTAKGEQRQAWLVDYFDSEGKRHRKAFDKKADAKDWQTTALGEVKAGTHTPDSASPTVKAACEAWVKRGEVEGLEASTMRQRRLHVDHILGRAATKRQRALPGMVDGDAKLTTITVAKLEASRDDLLRAVSKPMARKIIVSLRSILKQAKALHLLSANMAVKGAGRHTHKLKVGVDIPTKDEIKALVEGTTGDLKARALVFLAAFAGMSASEMRGLRWSNIDLDKGMVTVEERADERNQIGSPKSAARHRTVNLNTPTVTTLREWKLKQGGRALVFGTSADRPDGLANLRRRVLAPAMVAAGVVVPVLDDKGKPVTDDDGKPMVAAKYTRLHALRHFAVSSWLETCNGDFKAVQKRAGHATLAMTLDVYGHLLSTNDEDQIAAAEKLVFG